MKISFNDIVCMADAGVTVRNYRHRTTVPSKIFGHLKIKDKDKLRWILLKDGTVVIQKV